MTRVVRCVAHFNYFASTLLSGNYTFGEDLCQCTTYDTVGPYCERWRGASAALCYLKKSRKSKYCPGAKASSIFVGIYFTEDEIVCNKSECEY